MEQSDQNAAMLLHSRECPFDYKCAAQDCVDCLKVYMEKGESNETALE